MKIDTIRNTMPKLSMKGKYPKQSKNNNGSIYQNKIPLVIGTILTGAAITGGILYKNKTAQLSPKKILDAVQKHAQDVYKNEAPKAMQKIIDTKEHAISLLDEITKLASQKDKADSQGILKLDDNKIIEFTKESIKEYCIKDGKKIPTRITNFCEDITLPNNFIRIEEFLDGKNSNYYIINRSQKNTDTPVITIEKAIVEGIKKNTKDVILCSKKQENILCNVYNADKNENTDLLKPLDSVFAFEKNGQLRSYSSLSREDYNYIIIYKNGQPEFIQTENAINKNLWRQFAKNENGVLVLVDKNDYTCNRIEKFKLQYHI